MSNKNQNNKFAVFYENKPLKSSNDEIKPLKSSNDEITFDLYDLEYYGNYVHVKEFLDLPSKMINNKRLLEWLSIDDLSLWWFIAPTLHGKFKEASLFVNRFENFVKYNDIKILKVVTGFDKIHLINQICLRYNISIQKSHKNYFLFRIKKFLKFLTKKIRYKSIINKKIKNRLLQYTGEPFLHCSNNDYVLFTSPGIYRRKTIDHLCNISKEEFFLQPMINFCIENKIDISCIDLDYTFKGTTVELNERLQTKFNWFPIEYVLTKFPNNFTVNKKLKIISNNLEELKNNNLQNFFQFNNISLWTYLEDVFDEIFLEPYLPTYLKLIASLEQFLEKNPPQTIIQVYEAGPYAKCFQYVAKKLKIKTIAIQHGLIPSDYPDYMFKEIRDNDEYGNIIPDLTLVYGDYYKQLLTKNGSYPLNKVSSFGHPTYFNLEQIKQSVDVKKLKNEYGIKNKKIILVPLSFRLSYNQNHSDRILLDSIYKNFKNSNDVIILVRPHPGNFDDQETLNKLYPEPNFKISNNTLIEDLLLCDIVTVVVGTTVATEAILFDKTVILVDVSKNQYSNIDEVHFEMINKNIAQLLSIDEFSCKIIDIVNQPQNLCQNEPRNDFKKSFFNTDKKPNFDFLKNDTI